jgi:hypothetical protein
MQHMSTTTVSPERLLERATELVKSDRNLDMLDRMATLRGYLGLRTLDPENGSYRKNVEDAVASLLNAAHQYNHWHLLAQSEETTSPAAR